MKNTDRFVYTWGDRHEVSLETAADAIRAWTMQTECPLDENEIIPLAAENIMELLDSGDIVLKPVTGGIVPVYYGDGYGTVSENYLRRMYSEYFHDVWPDYGIDTEETVEYCTFEYFILNELAAGDLKPSTGSVYEYFSRP